MFRSSIAFVGMVFLVLLFVGEANAAAPQKFKIFLNSTECLGIAGGSNRKGALLVVERCAVKASQVFEIYSAAGPAVRQTIKTAAGYCIDIPGGNTNNGSVIQQWDCDKSDEQAFRMPVWTRASQPINIGRILAPHSGKCLDSVSRPSVRQNTCNGSATQNFYVVEIPAAPVIPFSSVPAATPLPAAILPAASLNAAFLNNEVRKDRAQMPFMVNALQLVAVESLCPVGCDQRGTGDALMYRAKTTLLASSAAFQGEVRFLKNDYCTRPGTASKASLRSKNISMWFTFLDQFNNQIAQRLFTPSTCVGVTPAGSAGTSPVNLPPASAAGANVEDQFWNAVKNSVSPADFQAYLNNYPAGKYASVARLKISQLTGASTGVSPAGPVIPGAATVEDQYWAAVRNSTNARDFQAYLNSYPNGKYAPIARLKINQLGGSVGGVGAGTVPLPSTTGSTVEQQYWDTIKNSPRPQDFRNYLRDYPNGQFVPIARLKISQLSSNPTFNPSGTLTVEDQYWNNINNSQRAQDFQDYLYSYPNGKYAALARLKMGQLGGQQQNPATGTTPEDQYWNNVRNSVRLQDFQSYLNLYPNGRYSAIARLKISQLGGSSFGANSTPFPNRPALAGLLSRAQYGKLDDLLGKTRFWVMTDFGDSNSKRKITKKLTKDFRKLTSASNEQVADFFVFFTLTDKNGALVNANTSYLDQTIKGTMKVFTATRGPNGAWNLRIVFEVSRYQAWDAAGNPTNIFGKHPADAAAGRFTKDLKKIKF